jgi:hypothetical protein
MTVPAGYIAGPLIEQQRPLLFIVFQDAEFPVDDRDADTGGIEYRLERIMGDGKLPVRLRQVLQHLSEGARNDPDGVQVQGSSQVPPASGTTSPSPAGAG